MAQIHIGRGTTNLGAFTEEEVREGLRTGRFVMNDLAWREGMENWKPLSEFAEFTAPPVEPALPSVLTDPAQEPAERPGLPWDQRETLGFIPAFIQTMKRVLLEPGPAFSDMKREGGIGDPLVFAITGGWIGGAFAFAYNFMLQALTHGAAMGMAGSKEMPAFLTGAGMSGIGLVAMLIFLPVIMVIAVFIGAGITHLCLMLLGGARQPFETTLRVTCFCVGSTALLQVVPLCGGYVTGIWNVIAQCIGMARAHEIPTGKAVTAVLLPMIICCGSLFVCALLVGFAVASRMH
jgi:hypothetical protein